MCICVCVFFIFYYIYIYIYIYIYSLICDLVYSTYDLISLHEFSVILYR